MNAVLVALALASAVQSQQFDLVCATTAGQEHIRVDLTQGKWCEADCSAVHPVAEVHPGSIFFTKESAEEEVRQILHFRAVNRVTGEYWHVNERLRDPMRLNGKCERTDFSGFPELRTKF